MGSSSELKLQAHSLSPANHQADFHEHAERKLCIPSSMDFGVRWGQMYAHFPVQCVPEARPNWGSSVRPSLLQTVTGQEVRYSTDVGVVGIDSSCAAVRPFRLPCGFIDSGNAPTAMLRMLRMLAPFASIISWPFCALWPVLESKLCFGPRPWG